MTAECDLEPVWTGTLETARAKADQRPAPGGRHRARPVLDCVRAALAESFGPLRASDVARMTGLGLDPTLDALYRLVRDGEAVSDGRGKRGPGSAAHPRRYRLRK